MSNSGVPTGDGVSQAASLSSATSASHVLKKHEEEFFAVVNPTLNLRLLKRKEVISGELISMIENANTNDAKHILFEHLHCYADVASLREYCKMAREARSFPKMQNLGKKMLNELALEEPITERPEAVTGRTDRSPKEEGRSSTKEAATFSIMFVLVVLVCSFLVFPVLQVPSSDQKAVARYKVDEEVRKGLKEETSAEPGQVTGGSTATTTGCQPQTQSAVPGQVTGGPTAAARGSQPPTQVAVSPLIKAAKFGKVTSVRKLLDEGAATVEDRDENGSNALHIAAKFGHLELVKFLIPIFGEKKFAVNHSGDTCLDLAIKHEEEDIVEYLIQEGGFGRQH